MKISEKDSSRQSSSSILGQFRILSTCSPRFDALPSFAKLTPVFSDPSAYLRRQSRSRKAIIAGFDWVAKTPGENSPAQWAPTRSAAEALEGEAAFWQVRRHDVDLNHESPLPHRAGRGFLKSICSLE